MPIGGFRMLDGDEVDDKIVAVLKDDTTYGTYSDISDVSESTLERLRHYFLTYKQAPGCKTALCQITQPMVGRRRDPSSSEVSRIIGKGSVISNRF
jgi:inorganic pyrophosphatase